MTDDPNDPVPDPWEDLGGPEPLEADGGLDFSFTGFAADEPAEEAAVLPFEPPGSGPGTGAHDPAVGPPVVSETSEPGEAEEFGDDIADWLTEPASSAVAADDAPVVDLFEPGEAIDEAVDVATVAGFVGGSSLVAGDGLEVVPSAAVAPVPRGAVKKKSRGGAAVGAILGGLLSIPVVFLILLGVLWATGRDPLAMRSFLPAFLLPGREVADRGAVASVNNTSAGEAADSTEPVGGEATASEDDSISAPRSSPLPSSDREDADTSPAPTSEPVAEDGDSPADPPAVATVVPAPAPAVPMAVDQPAIPVGELPVAAVTTVPPVPVVDPFAAPAVPAPGPASGLTPPEPPPLDLSGLAAAVDDAVAALDEAKVDGGAATPEQRRLLVAWYKQLARVGEEMAVLETAAADAGRPLDDTPAPVLELYGRIAATDGIAADLDRLCRNWIDFSKRPADGVLLVGTLEAARQVGPFWHLSLGLKEVDGSLREVSVIARREPRASVGERVGVAGVVFSGDVVWAADCGPLETVAETDPF